MAKTDDPTWDSFEDELNLVSTDRCLLGQYLDSLEPEYRSLAEAALADKRISGNSIYKALVSRGLEAGDSVLKVHRSGTCLCARSKGI